MIQEFVRIWDEHKSEVEDSFRSEHPSYGSIVEAVVKMIHDHWDGYENPDPSRIHRIDDGDYHGTLLYVIASDNYQPSTYWAVYVGYGSCSGCDTLQAISGYADGPPSEEQIKDYMGLALNVLQGLKEI
jgi:hypothetical protein